MSKDYHDYKKWFASPHTKRLNPAQHRTMRRFFLQKVNNRSRIFPSHQGWEKEDAILARIRRFAGNTTARRRSSKKSFPVYRVKGLPIEPFGNIRHIPQWRSLSDWMKAQMGLLAMSPDRTHSDNRYMMFNCHIHSTIIARWEATGRLRSLGEMIRDDINRQCRAYVGHPVSFFFVIEEYDRNGGCQTRPHIHGAIQIPPVRLRTLRGGGYPKRIRRMVQERSQDFAQREQGRLLVKQAVSRAVGHKYKRRPRSWGHEKRNVRFQKPYGTVTAFVTYAFKNVDKPGHFLDEQRFFKNHGFIADARGLWNIVTGRSV